MPDARYLVFTSYQPGKQSVKAELTEAFDKTYYEVLNMELAMHPQTILAYEMNGEPLPIPHGAPLRLRVETLLGKQVLPDDLPFVTGTIGLLGTKPSYDMMMGCDTLLMIGSTLPYGQFLPKEGQAGVSRLTSMGPAVPYAIAAKFAYPDRIPIALTGDGAMQMNGLAAMITVKKYWKQWSDPRLIFMVLNNRDLHQVTSEMRIEAGNPKLPATQDLPDFHYASYAESLGLKGIRVDRPEDVGAAWDAALSADRPVVFEAYVSSDVTTIPPHISFEQAKNYASALLTGDPDEGGIIKESIMSVVEGVIPHKH